MKGKIRMNTFTSNTPNEYSMVFNAEQISQLLQISRAGAYSLLNRNDFPAFRVGKRILVPQAAFYQWLETQSHQHEKATTE